MPRRVTKPVNEVRSVGYNRGMKVEKKSFAQDVQGVWGALTSERGRIIMGVLLLCVVLMGLISCVSFFFTGADDFSIIEQDLSRKAMRAAIHNALGLPGAIVSRALIDGAYGVMVVLPIVYLGLVSVRLMYRFDCPLGRLLFWTLFLLIWGSTLLGFVQLESGWGSFRWGGAHGEWLAGWAVSYVQGLGLSMILGTVLVIFLVLIDPHFTAHCARLAGIFRCGKEPEEPENPDSPAYPESPENPEEEVEEFVITIEKPEDPEYPESPASPENPDKPEDSESTKMDIVAPEEVEIVDKQVLGEWEKLPPYDPRKDLEWYKFPTLNLLKVYDNETAPVIDQAEQHANGARIVNALRNFDIEIESIKATVGPTVTLYEIVPKAGIKIAKIQNLENDIMMSLAAKGIRIIAPMPGKGTIGIEVPNEKPQVVSMHSVVASKRFQEEKKMRLPIVIGRTITNEVFMFDLAKAPHLLVAGATGQGKSVAINAIITSLLYKKHPAELKFVLVDPKMVEFAPYKELMRHYLAAMPDTDPNQIIITECSEVTNVLNSLVIEMENRYKLLMDAGVRNMEDYNEKFVARRLNPEKLVDGSLHHRFMPYIVIIIDEYGDFIMQVGKQVETPISRIAAKARAVGMHMILATQRPSVNIVTGVIKANIPTRIALRTQSVVDSRTVLDAKGADQLIGRGDMLYSANGDITRIQCAFVDTPEVDAIVEHIQKQQHYGEPYPLPEYIPEGSEGEALMPGSVDMKHLDPMFADIARYVVSKQEGSTSRLQRAFEIGYNRAGKLSDQLEAAGIVGPNKGPKGRDVLIQDMDTLNELLAQLGV